MDPAIRSYALQLARSSGSRFRMGAVVYRGGRVLGGGVNDMTKTHPAMKGKPWPFLHAEVAACLDAGLSQLRGTSIYVARVLRNDQEALAQPCAFCSRFLARCGITDATWTVEPNTPNRPAPRARSSAALGKVALSARPPGRQRRLGE